jgi:hypothetical protein
MPPASYLGLAFKTWLHRRSQKTVGVILLPKNAPTVPSNSQTGGVLSRAPDNKSCVKKAIYPHSAPLSPHFYNWEDPKIPPDAWCRIVFWDHRWRCSNAIHSAPPDPLSCFYPERRTPTGDASAAGCRQEASRRRSYFKSAPMTS